MFNLEQFYSTLLIAIGFGFAIGMTAAFLRGIGTALKR